MRPLIFLKQCKKAIQELIEYGKLQLAFKKSKKLAETRSASIYKKIIILSCEFYLLIDDFFKGMITSENKTKKSIEIATDLYDLVEKIPNSS